MIFQPEPRPALFVSELCTRYTTPWLVHALNIPRDGLNLDNNNNSGGGGGGGGGGRSRIQVDDSAFNSSAAEGEEGAAGGTVPGEIMLLATSACII